MRLTDALASMGAHADDDVIYIRGDADMSPESDAVILENADRAAPSGYRYLLEIGLAKEVLSVFEEWRSREPSADERVTAVLYYAEHDAYLPNEGEPLDSSTW